MEATLRTSASPPRSSYPVHLPFTWAAISSSGENPADASSPYNPGEWLVALFAIPLATAAAGLLAWRETRR